MASQTARTVWFYRRFVRLSGGHLKHAHYFRHVADLPGFKRRIVFEGGSRDPADVERRKGIWGVDASTSATRWAPQGRDILFVGGVDWRYLLELRLDKLSVPRINLIQHVRHAHEGTELRTFLSQRAVRICVSPEVAEAIVKTGEVDGPVVAIPNGIDLPPFDPAARGALPWHARPVDVLIVGYKRPELAREVGQHLRGNGMASDLATDFLPRHEFLRLLGRSRLAVCLPDQEEGFYLPALEAMAAGCTVVTLDCVGNRSFCHDRRNCLVAQPTSASIAETVEAGVSMPRTVREEMHLRSSDTVRAHSLDAERAAFHAILGDIDRLWRHGPSEVVEVASA